DPRVENRQAGAAEEGTGAREERLFVGEVDQRLQGGAVTVEARLDDRFAPLDAPPQMARVPGDLVRRVPLEIGDVELSPETILGAFGNRVEAQEPARLALAQLDTVGKRRRCAYGVGKPRARRAEELLEEPSLPRVPYDGARPADVGDGEQIECDEPPLGADDAREALDYLGVGDVLLLRSPRHRQVLGNQPHDERGVVGVQSM